MVIAVYAFDGRAASPTWRQDMIISHTLSERQQGLDIHGQIPKLSDSFGPAYARINNEVNAEKNNLIEGTRRLRARSITFSYEVFHTNDVVSLVIMANTRAVTDRTTVTSVNFNPRTGALLSLNQAMGMDITPLAEGIIADMIRQNPARYYAAFTASPTGQAFYLTDTLLVLLFDEFQLSSVPNSTRTIQFVRSNIRRFDVARNSYRISQDRYEIKMMPLRFILERMGYDNNDLSYNDGQITISRNGRTRIILNVGENNFQVNGVMQRSLETAPINVDGNIYVPISFFDQILGLTAYSIDPRGNITFMTYMRG